MFWIMCVCNLKPLTRRAIPHNSMSASDYLSKNCTAADFEIACPKKWSQLKPSFMASVPDCHRCHRKVYLCASDADLKLCTSLSYCIAVIKPQTLAEKESEARTNTQQRPMRKGGNQWMEDEVFMGIPARGRWSGNPRSAPGLRVVPKDHNANEIPEYLRK